MIIQTFNGKVIPGSKEPLLVKFADGGNKKKNQVRHTARAAGDCTKGALATTSFISFRFSLSIIEQYKSDGRGWRDNGSGEGQLQLHYADQSVAQNGVAQLMPATMAAAAGYPRAPYSAAQIPSTAYHQVRICVASCCRSVMLTVSVCDSLQAAAIPASWMHPAATPYHLVQPHHAAHMQTQAMAIPSQSMDPNAAALHFSALMPQLSAQMSQLQLSGASVRVQCAYLLSLAVVVV